MMQNENIPLTNHLRIFFRHFINIHTLIFFSYFKIDSLHMGHS